MTENAFFAQLRSELAATAARASVALDSIEFYARGLMLGVALRSGNARARQEARVDTLLDGGWEPRNMFTQAAIYRLKVEGA